MVTCHEVNLEKRGDIEERIGRSLDFASKLSPWCLYISYSSGQSSLVLNKYRVLVGEQSKDYRFFFSQMLHGYVQKRVPYIAGFMLRYLHGLVISRAK